MPLHNYFLKIFLLRIINEKKKNQLQNTKIQTEKIKEKRECEKGGGKGRREVTFFNFSSLSLSLKKCD